MLGSHSKESEQQSIGQLDSECKSVKGEQAMLETVLIVLVILLILGVVR